MILRSLLLVDRADEEVPFIYPHVLTEFDHVRLKYTRVWQDVISITLDLPIVILTKKIVLKLVTIFRVVVVLEGVVVLIVTLLANVVMEFSDHHEERSVISEMQTVML